MQPEIVSTSAAPAAVGPYSQAVRVGQFIYTSGQIGMRLDSGGLDGDIVAQTTQALANLQAVLAAAGSSLNQVVKTTVFLQDMDHFTAMNEVYSRHFGDRPPARSTVQVARLPLGALVEIEAVAVLS
ncbi:MAG: RidA family protein [Candidatus Promineifilaceae bacterium]|nr:RidA family protein [Candidatus Promineifilaceae bacterium]